MTIISDDGWQIGKPQNVFTISLLYTYFIQFGEEKISNPNVAGQADII